MLNLIISHLAALVLGVIIGFMVSSLCVTSSMDEREDYEEED